MASNPNMTTDDSNDDDLPETAEIVTPETQDDGESQYDSPVERMRQELPEKLHRSFVASSDDHPLVQTAGTKEALTSNTPVAVQKILSDGLYEDTGVFFREWLQNHLAAITREAKRRLIDEYGEGALFRTVEHTHPDMDGTRTIRLPKQTEAIIDAAKDIGYHPSIEFILNHDEGKLTTRDNGIGMTTGEAIEVWNEPAVSGSGVDLSSAGNKGIGSLTWVTIAGEEGAMTVKTRTKRERTINGEYVPPRDRAGYQFYSYFGGMIPVDGEVDFDAGTQFEIPIQDDVDAHDFKGHLKKYADVLPTQVSWVEIVNGERDEDEFDRTTFLGRYSREPAVVIERPGEFTIALDTSDVVAKNVDDTFLLDNPIDRNTSYSQSFDTLWNDHIQLHNEQGLIVAGPNRGKLRSQVDELAGDIGDITDASKPMPDVPLPEPVASRDSFKRDEAHSRFIKYAEHIAKEKELSVVEEFVNSFLGAGSTTEALEYLRQKDSTYTLFYKLAKKHAGNRVLSNPRKLATWFDQTGAFDFSLERIPEVQPGDESHKGITNHSSSAKQDIALHRMYPLVELLVDLQDEVSVATAESRGDPNLKENRKSRTLGDLIGEGGHWPLFIGATINADRAETIWHDKNYPNAAVLKVNSYGKWQSDPWNAHLVKEVPMTHEANEECDEDWFVPDHINEAHVRTPTTNNASDDGDDGDSIDLTDPDNFQDRPVDLRCTKNAAIDLTTTIGDLMEALDKTETGDPIVDGVNVGQPHLVVFPDNTEHNVSDHYDLSQFAGIIKCNAQEAEALLNYEQVYEWPEYDEMVRSVRHNVYDPINGRGWSEGIERTLERDDFVWVHADDPVLVDALYGNDIEVLNQTIETTDSRYSDVRNAILDNFTPGLDSDTDWVAVFWKGDYAEKVLCEAHWRLNTNIIARRKPLQVFYYDYGNQPENTLDKRKRNADDEVEKAMHPAWDSDSKMWSRMNESYRGPKSYEKAIHRALRDAGIDPAEDHDPDTLERVLGHLLTRCDDK